MKRRTVTENRAFPRDLPFGGRALPEDEGRKRLRTFVQNALAAAGDYDGVVLGLPSRITSEGDAESSTYPGLYGPVKPLFGSLFQDVPWVVPHDSVLTARGYPPETTQKTLALTMGFGVGAALWHAWC